MKRRDFLTTAAASASLGALNTTFAANEKRRIKYGQVGTEHAHAAGQMETVQALKDDYEVVGIAQASPDATSRQPYQNVPQISLAELLASDAEVIAVETSPLDSLAVAQKCIEAGKHIHLDKPAGESLPDLERLHKSAAERSLTIQMGYMYRYNPAFQFMFHAVREGWLGDIFEIHSVMSKTVGDGARKSLAKFPGGSMFELGCHLIDPLIHMLGTPDNVVAFNRATRNDKLLDNTFAVFEYPHATASVRSALVEVDGFRRRQFAVCGNQGTIVIRPLDSPKLELTLSKPHGNYQQGTHQVELPKSQGRYHGAWSELAEVIRGEKRLPFSHEHDVTVQRALLTACGLGEWKDHGAE